MADYEKLVPAADEILRNLLVEQNYDSVSNFLWLYDSYQNSGEPLHQFLNSYCPPVRKDKFTCVGLAFELMVRFHDFDKDFPEFASSCALVSCKEGVTNVEEYVMGGECPDSPERLEKEHVLVAVAIKLDSRPGLIIADPGYHVPWLVTIMEDEKHPHTGWIVHTDDPENLKEFNYVFNRKNKNFLEWHEKKVKHGISKTEISLIYVGRPYLGGINVTERRNLVYELKSVMARDRRGRIFAGLFFKVREKDSYFNIVIGNGPGGKIDRYKFSDFLDSRQLSEATLADIKKCNKLMNYPDGELLKMICKLAHVLSDVAFVKEMLVLNGYIKGYYRDLLHQFDTSTDSPPNNNAVAT